MQRKLWHGIGLVVAGGMLAFSTASADEVARQSPKPTPEELARWVQELDADAYPVREAATKQLLAAGVDAIEPLAGALLNGSAEVVSRAGTSLKRIALQGDVTTLNRISAALQKLNTEHPALTSLAAEIRGQQQKYRHKQAIAQLRRLGGNLTGRWEDPELAFAGAVVADEVAVAADPAIFVFDKEKRIEAVAELAEAELVDQDVRGTDELPPTVEAPAAEPKGEEPKPVEVKVAEAMEEVPVVPPRGLLGIMARLFDPPEPVPAFPLPVFEAPELPVEREPAPVAPAVEVVEDVLPEKEVEIKEVEVAEFDAADVVAVEAFVAPLVFDDFGGDSDSYAELTLDKSFRGSDADLAVLRDIPEIYDLSIQGAKLTDEALEHIAHLKRLTTLTIQGTEFSPAALRKLRQKRSEISIICRSSAMLGINATLDGPCILSSVFRRSGAYAAGLRDGDEIIEVDGQKVRDFSDLTIAIYPHKPGDVVPVKFRRQGEVKAVNVELKPRADVE